MHHEMFPNVNHMWSDSHDKNPVIKFIMIGSIIHNVFNFFFISFYLGYIDDIVEPNQTRKRICDDLELLAKKELKNPKKKHGNIPLWEKKFDIFYNEI